MVLYVSGSQLAESSAACRIARAACALGLLDFLEALDVALTLRGQYRILVARLLRRLAHWYQGTRG